MRQWFTQREFDYPSCHLLTGFNAVRFLGGEINIEPASKEFESLVDLVHCRYGAAISVEEAWPLLGIEVEYGPHDFDWIKEKVKAGRPVGISAFSPDYGLHSGLVVSVEGEDLHLVNWLKTEDVTVVPFAELVIPPYAKERAEAFSLKETEDV